jgi:hypothetical protein
VTKYQIYHLIHLVGLSSVLLALGAAALATFVPEERIKQIKKALGIVHGVAIAGMLVSGFGMLAVLDIHGMPLWVWIKLTMWLLLAASLGMSYRLGPKQPLVAVFLPVVIAMIAMIVGSLKVGA